MVLLRSMFKSLFKPLVRQPLFWGVLCLKIVLITLFSSDYESAFFQPFVEHFIENGGNTWQVVWDAKLPLEFPYHPIMLWIISAVYAPFYWLGSILGVDWIQSLGFQMSSLGADLVILLILMRLFPYRIKSVLLYYYASPIILYAVFMHGQLDLVPTALLLAATYTLKKRSPVVSGVLMGCAAATKFHTIVAFPMLAVFLWKNQSGRSMLTFVLSAVGLWSIVESGYVGSEGFQQLVLFNQKQFLWHDVILSIGERKVYLPVLAMSSVLAYFLSFRRCNFDLLLAFLGSAFSILVALITPEPGWYVWMVPFWVPIIVKNQSSAPHLKGLYVGLSSIYLIYFLGFHPSAHVDLLFLGQSLLNKSVTPNHINMVYSVLETGILLSILMLFHYGIRSNALYRRQEALVIGISGDSGVGKTHLLQRLKKVFKDKLVELEGDGEHKWERGDANWDLLTHLDPKANALHKQADYIRSLKFGQTIHRREYDHDTGQFTELRKIKPQDWVVLSGLHTFYLPKMRKLIDLKVFMDTDEDLRQHWKILRDSQKRDKTPADVIASIKKREKDAQKFVHPQKKFADILINYFPLKPIKVGDPSTVVELGLRVTLNANLHLERFVESCAQSGQSVLWDYADDLETQTLTFHSPIASRLLLGFLRRELPNSSDLIDEETVFSEDYDGVVMCLLLWLISATLQTESK